MNPARTLKYTTLVFSLLLSSCVSLPKDIEPKPVSEDLYSSFNCTDLRHEQYKTQMALIPLIEDQMELRRNQSFHPVCVTTANVLFELSLTQAAAWFWLIYPIIVNQMSHDDEIAELKGKLVHLQNLADQKGCTEIPDFFP